MSMVCSGFLHVVVIKKRLIEETFLNSISFLTIKGKLTIKGCDNVPPRGCHWGVEHGATLPSIARSS